LKEAENEEKCMIKLHIVKMMKMKVLVRFIIIINLLTQIKIVIILLMMILMKAKHLMIKNYKNISKMLVLQVYKEQGLIQTLEVKE